MKHDYIKAIKNKQGKPQLNSSHYNIKVQNLKSWNNQLCHQIYFEDSSITNNHSRLHFQQPIKLFYLKQRCFIVEQRIWFDQYKIPIFPLQSIQGPGGNKRRDISRRLKPDLEQHMQHQKQSISLCPFNIGFGDCRDKPNQIYDCFCLHLIFISHSYQPFLPTCSYTLHPHKPSPP